MSQRRIGMVCSRVRMEEKLLLEAFARHPEVAVVRVDDDQFQAPPAGPGQASGHVAARRRCDVVLLRCLSYVRQVTMARVLEAGGVATVNRAAVLETTGDKRRTTLALAAAGIPTPPARVAFTVEAGLEAVEALVYPCAVKPVTGFWGRLVAQLNDRDAAEAVLEHKALLGGALHRVLYLPAHVDKRGRDLRAFVVGDRTVAVIGRRSPHWVTNIARGAVAAELGVEWWRALVAELNQGALGCDAPHLHLPALESAGDGLRDTVRLRLGFRLPSRLSGQVVIDRLRQLDPKAHLEIERSEPAVTVPRSGPLPTAFSRAIRAAGRRPDWQQRLATSDRNVVLPVWKCAAVVYGPGDAELDHTPLESIALDDYGRAIEVLTRVLTEL